MTGRDTRKPEQPENDASLTGHDPADTERVSNPDGQASDLRKADETASRPDAGMTDPTTGQDDIRPEATSDASVHDRDRWGETPQDATLLPDKDADIPASETLTQTFAHGQDQLDEKLDDSAGSPDDDAAVPEPELEKTGLFTRLKGLLRRKAGPLPDDEPASLPEYPMASQPHDWPAGQGQDAVSADAIRQEGQQEDQQEETPHVDDPVGLPVAPQVKRQPGFLKRILSGRKRVPEPEPVVHEPLPYIHDDDGQASFITDAPPEAPLKPAAKAGLFGLRRKQVEAGPTGDIPVLPTIRSERSRPRKRGALPVNVLIGWLQTASRRDVIEHARGFADDHFDTLETGWLAMEQFLGGYLFEIHEGGAGVGYLPEIVEELTRDPDQVVWVPSGVALNRVLTVRISDGEAFVSLLTEEESVTVRRSGQDPLERTGRMKPLLPKGNKILAAGLALSVAGAVALAGAYYYAGTIDRQPIPSRSLDFELLPHQQITNLSASIRRDRWVSQIVFEDGQWRADFQEVEDIVLPVDDDEAQAIIDETLREQEEIRSRLRDAIERELDTP